ncbi:MAG TPA: arginine--tRNA ligase [Acidimicrobiales bacterium]|nr:arginine--tRNA ligase [Acidimicrobiales bacterium]
MAPEQLRAAIAGHLADLGAPDNIKLERPRNPEHGDWALNAFPLAKGADRSGPELATALADRLNAAPPAHLLKAEVIGGFVNLRLDDGWLHDVLRAVVEEGTDGYARPELGHGKRINVEFVSANPTGPLHAGHGRWAAYGDSVARLLARCGYEPHTEFYVNDRGVQLERFGLSLAARANAASPPDDGYHGAYVSDWASEMPDDADPTEWGRAKALAYQRDTLAAMGVSFETWTSERELVASGAVEAALADLRQRGGVYEADGAVWLRTSEHGDDKDRVLIRSDGEPTYFLPDIAYHRDKLARADHLINILGSDHHGYINRMRAAIEILGFRRDALEVIIGQNVTLLRDGVGVKLSKRSGDIIELMADVLDEVGPDATRFTYLQQSIDTRLMFDLDIVVQRTMDNPVFYVQMAHARLAGIARNAHAKGVERRPLAEVDLGLLAHQRELDILALLNDLPDVVREATQRRAPNKVVTWLRDLAAAVHGFHHDCWVIADDVPPELSQARLWLVEAARIGMVIALDLVGVSAPEQM